MTRKDALTGWWPAPRKFKYGEPRRMAFWSELLWAIIIKQGRNKSPTQIMKDIEDTWGVDKIALKGFLEHAGLLESFNKGALNPVDIFPVFEAASGMWTPGTRKDIQKKHFGSVQPSKEDDTPVTGIRSPNKVSSNPNLFWRNKSQQGSNEQTGRFKKKDIDKKVNDNNESLEEVLSGSAWMFYNHYLEDSKTMKNTDIAKEEARRRAINPWLGGNPTILQESINNEFLEEGTSGSAWMFYHHYNPELLQAIQQVLVGSKVEDIVDELLEVEELLCKGNCEKCKAGTCPIGEKLNCPTNNAANE